MTEEKGSTRDISPSGSGSKPSSGSPTTDSNGSTGPPPSEPPVNTNTGQSSQITAATTNRGRSGEYRSSEPLEYEGHEALAQYLASPEPLREFRSITAFAKHYKISRMTVHRWRHAPDVLQRADWLSKQNRLTGAVVARANWETIVLAQVKRAIGGDTSAAKFLREIAWTEHTPADHTLKEVAWTVIHDD